MAITSNTMSSAAGDITFQFLDSADRDNIGSGQTMDLIDVGGINYVFDELNPNEDIFGSVNQFQDPISITIWDTLSDGSSLESKLRTYSDNNPPSQGAYAPCQLTIDGYDWFVVFRSYEYSTDDIANTTTVKAFYGLFPVDLQNDPPALTGSIDDSDGTTLSPTVYPTGYLFADHLGAHGYSDWVTDSDQGFQHQDIPTGVGTYTWCAQDIDSYDQESYIAGFAGAYYGGGFSKGFYADRLYTGNSVTIDQDQILDISRTLNVPNIQTIDVSFSNNDEYTGGGITDTSLSQTIDTRANKTLELLLPDTSIISLGLSIYLTEWNDADSEQRLKADGDADADTDAQLQNIVDSYKASLAADSKLYINITIEGFDTVLPWQTFTITDTTGELGSYTSATYRFAQVTYNIDNTISAKAYEIA